MMTNELEYLSSHPWLDFRFDMGVLTSHAWRLIGRAETACKQISTTPFDPARAAEMNLVYLTKGVLGSTHIEGNSLSEDEIRRIIDGTSKQPPSREYMEREAQNIVDACNFIKDALVENPVGTINITPELIRRYNAMVLAGLEDHLEDGVVPGEYAKRRVTVANYLSPQPNEFEFLIERLSEFLNDDLDPTSEGDDWRFPIVLVKAILAHLYLVWIHAFGDGNGRVARLMELHILFENGIPMPAAHLLSDHYNRTRAEYYRQLRGTSAEGGSIVDFITYALQGLVDGLLEQLDHIRDHQMSIAWTTHVHRAFNGLQSPAQSRRRKLVLALPPDRSIRRSSVPTLSPELAALYAGKQSKTVTRDINALVDMNLIDKTWTHVWSRFDLLQSFLPLKTDEPQADDSNG